MPHVSMLDNLIKRESGVINITPIKAIKEPVCWLVRFFKLSNLSRNNLQDLYLINQKKFLSL